MLEVAMDDNPVTRGKLYEAYLKGGIVIPVGSDTSTRTDGGWEVDVICVTDSEGHPAAAIFTSEEALLRWRPDGPKYMVLPGREAFEFLSELALDRVYVNPGSPTWGMLMRPEFEALSRAELPRIGVTEKIDVKSNLRIGAPSPLHLEVSEAVTRIVEGEQRIAFAYLVSAEYQEQAHTSSSMLICVVRESSASSQGAVDWIGEELQAVIAEGRFIDILTVPSNHGLLGRVLGTGLCVGINDEDTYQRCLKWWQA